MIFILNILPLLIVALFAALGFKKYKGGTLKISNVLVMLVVCISSIILLNAVTPSYMPKGKPPVLSNPAFEKSDAEITDRNLKPSKTEEERQNSFDEKFNAINQVNGK